MSLPLLLLFGSILKSVAGEALLNQDFKITWAPDHVKFLDKDKHMELTLDRVSGSGFVSKDKYLFGSIDMQIKLVPGNSAGTVTAYYLFSELANHDELDFEFLGNETGQPYIVQTNVFAKGMGEREQRILLWFDPSTDFHTYSLVWNEKHIVFLIDNTPIRVFVNNEAIGVPFLKEQPMGLYSSIWNGDGWATRGGLVKIDWRQAPFVATYKNFKADACKVGGTSKCSGKRWWGLSEHHILDPEQRRKLKWVQSKYMVYNYCTDKARYPIPPPECTRPI